MNPVRPSSMSDADLGIVCAADVEIPAPPTWPKVARTKAGDYLVLKDRRRYRIPNDPIKVLGLLDHLAAKTWCERRFIAYAIKRIAAAKGWPIHPF